MYKLTDDGVLDISNRDLMSIDELPSGIRMLCCERNLLTKLPELPEGLLGLMCYNNNITYLPKLPNSLNFLECHYNPLRCIVPIKFHKYQHSSWLYNYKEYISSYKGQRNILIREPYMVSELMMQCTILPKIRKEFKYLIESAELNLM